MNFFNNYSIFFLNENMIVTRRNVKNREFIRTIYHKITDADIQDLKKGVVSVLVVRSFRLSETALFRELKRIGQFQRQDISRDFLGTSVINSKHPALPWHMDRSYHHHLPRFIALYALSVPEKKVGGETSYCDMQKAYEDLSATMKKEICDLQLLYSNKCKVSSYKKKFPISSAIHPLVQSDETGKYLFFDRDYAVNFHLKEKLCQHIYQTAYIYKHHWSSWDLVLSNNFKTNHQREKTVSPSQSPRVLTKFHLI